MESPSEKVLFTAEILENVLLYLDQRSLLTSAQRVSRYWHEIVSSSPSLQKHLFLQPDWDRSSRTINILLTETFPLWFPQGPTERRHSDKTQINIISSRAKRSGDTIFETLPIALRHKNKAFRHENATWRRMLVQQPPIPYLVSFFVIDSQWGGSSFSGPHPTTPYVTDRSFGNENQLHDCVKYWNSQVETDSLNMGTFYDTIIVNIGTIPWIWMILWDFGESNVPSNIDDFSFDDDSKENISQALQKYGMIVVSRRIRQCMIPSLWTPGRKFVYDMERLKALRVDECLPEEESFPENPPTLVENDEKKSGMRSMCSLCVLM